MHIKLTDQHHLQSRPVLDSASTRPAPGFAHFSATLQEALKGKLDFAQLEAYQDTLIAQLNASRLHLRQVFVPPSVSERLSPVVTKVDSLFEKFGIVLDLVEEHLENGSREPLAEAVSLLHGLPDQWGEIF